MEKLVWLPAIVLILSLVLYLFFQSLRRPALLIGLSVYTVSLDHMGRVQGSALTANNLLKLVLFGVFLLWMALSGKRLRLPRHLLWFLPFLVFCGVSTFYSPDLLRGSFYFTRLAVVWLYALIVANFVEKRSDMVIVLGSMVATALVVSVLAHMQTLNAFTLGAVEAFQKHGPEASGVRAMSTFWDSNRMAQFLTTLSLFMIATLSLRGLRRYWGAGILLVLFLSFGAILLSFSRGAWLTLVVAQLFFLRFAETRRVVGIFLLVGTVGAIYMAFFTPYGVALLDRLQTFGSLGSDFSGRFRTLLAFGGLQIWADGMHWLWGGGYQSFSRLVVEHWQYFMNHDMIYHSGTTLSHTLYATIIAEGGLLGVLLFLAFLRAVFREMRYVFSHELEDLPRAMMTGIWVFLAVKLVDWIFGASMMDNQFWLVLGLLGAMTSILRSERSAHPRGAALLSPR